MPAKPKLLAGGNPQIPKADGDAPVQAYIAALAQLGPAWKHHLCQSLDRLVTQTVPDVQRAVRWNTPFYGIETPDAKTWFLAYHCFNRYLKVTFLNGSRLNPLPPVESKHQGTRYLHLHEGEWKQHEDQLKNWIEQAAKLPGEACF